MHRTLFLPVLLSAMLLPALSNAQYNDKGTIHISLGIMGAAHATHYEQTTYPFGIPITHQEDDGAASVTVPIEAHYGFAKFFSLGLDIEPGVYLDSSDTQTNGLLLIGIQPRFYLIDHDHFMWMASLQFGSSSLRIHDSAVGVETTSTYKGTHFGLGTGIGIYLSDHFRLLLNARYLSNNFTLTDYEQNGTSQSLDELDAALTTAGFGLQAGVSFSF
ncbi:MAG TPA: hypothetical protein VKG92_02845 [Flavobacteriales bacterium]|nr:hypothetical protein [Flavobacteriales bacterium]